MYTAKWFELSGRVLFWLTWPIWFFYLRLGGVRSRVLVVLGNEILLLKGWINPGRLMLPGGGAKAGELIKDAAIRELAEETGITASKYELVSIPGRTRSEFGLCYKAAYFYLELSSKPELKIGYPEIIHAGWYDAGTSSDIRLDKDAQYALEQYMRRSRT
ncbi:NUDIX hydrolase [Candidatus Saccharibacteria bacterium]|nr:NUDIX hydrolase [Candidatus Saccharibacteria bacterium]